MTDLFITEFCPTCEQLTAQHILARGRRECSGCDTVMARPCPACDGYGWHRVYNGTSTWASSTVDCGDCGGTGQGRAS